MLDLIQRRHSSRPVLCLSSALFYVDHSISVGQPQDLNTLALFPHVNTIIISTLTSQTCHIIFTLPSLSFPGVPKNPLLNILSSFCFPLFPHRPLPQKSPPVQTTHQAFLDRNKKLIPHHSTTTTPTIIPANLNIATLFPCCAMRPRRPAEPLMEVVIEEKTSDCLLHLLVR